MAATFLTTELLGPGTYTRTHNLSTGGSITRTETIPAGKTGAYYVIAHNGNEYQVFNAWTVSADGLSYDAFKIQGDELVTGPLAGSRLFSSFTIPDLALSVDIVGGTEQECNGTGGNNVTANATVAGGLTLDRIEWRLDGVYQGDGASIVLFIPLGGATVEATAIAADGVTTEQQSTFVNVTDTTSPALAIEFLDSSGVPVTSAAPGDYVISINTMDICDPAPATSSSAKPVMEVFDGDTITINSSNDVGLPTSAVEVSTTATDISGNSITSNAVLTIQ